MWKHVGIIQILCQTNKCKTATSTTTFIQNRCETAIPTTILIQTHVKQWFRTRPCLCGRGSCGCFFMIKKQLHEPWASRGRPLPPRPGPKTNDKLQFQLRPNSKTNVKQQFQPRRWSQNQCETAMPTTTWFPNQCKTSVSCVRAVVVRAAVSLLRINSGTNHGRQEVDHYLNPKPVLNSSFDHDRGPKPM